MGSGGAATRADPNIWRNAIKTSLRDRGAILISGRLLSLVTDGIVAHANKRKDNCSCVGAVFQLVRDIGEATRGLYGLEPQPNKLDSAHTNLVRLTTVDFRNDEGALTDEVDMLNSVFAYRHPDDLTECEEKAGWRA